MNQTLLLQNKSSCSTIIQYLQYYDYYKLNKECSIKVCKQDWYVCTCSINIQHVWRFNMLKRIEQHKQYWFFMAFIETQSRTDKPK